ncbi:uncharacterized protein LOC124114560 [Haliotis rufescens]|uniref:uncharacterized protein LOC124114560 n=1 Tax=Haliotis rufescens TaxID=6454 RepID=UPI00201EA297|nr:uncharacterized protein LOC124114560 [Haliotis rufescens]XP_048246207.1 uncharacterized protein LOC124114560 [Haliotis rufescens]XP_048246208.1 uncharacterized protein LOC124114560 [Haliotis rufescens]
MQPMKLGALFLLPWVIVLYNKTPVEANPIPVIITCYSDRRFYPVFALSLIMGNITITVDNKTQTKTSSTDLWNLSVSCLFDNGTYLVGKGQIDCSLVGAIKCEGYGLLETEYKHVPSKPEFEFEFDGKGVVKTNRKTYKFLTCWAPTGAADTKMWWQTSMDGTTYTNVNPANYTVTTAMHDACHVRTSSELKYESNTKAFFRCLFGEREVGSILVGDSDSETETDLSLHFFWSTMTCVYVPLILSTIPDLLYVQLPRLQALCQTSDFAEKLEKKLKIVCPLLPCIWFMIFLIWWIILLVLSKNKDFLRFFILEAVVFLLHCVFNIFCSIPATNGTHVNKWRRAVCFAVSIIPAVCWVMLRGQAVDTNTTLELIWWLFTGACFIVNVQAQL